MSFRKRAWNLYRFLVHRRDVESEFDAELDVYLDLAVQEHMRRGVPREAAERMARLELGGAEQVKEADRAARIGSGLESIWQDVRTARRTLGRNRSFAFLAVFMLALGIGASTSVASIVQAVLLRPLPYTDPERLAFVWRGRTVGEPNHGVLTGPQAIELRERAALFEEVAVTNLWLHNLAPQMDIQGQDGAERLRGSFATPNFFDLLGVAPEIGRSFDDEARAVAVISHDLWQRRFGGDPDVIGQRIDLMMGTAEIGQGSPRAIERHVVIGVLPERFHFTYPEETEVWVPLPWDSISTIPAVVYTAVGRLRPGATPDQAGARITRTWEDAGQRYDDFALVEPLSWHVQHDVQSGVWLLAVSAALVLVIACVNIALLFVAHTVSRTREITIRSALGATSWRLVRSLAAESLLIAAAGSAIGILAAVTFEPALRAWVPDVVPRVNEIAVDLQVLGVAIAAGLITALVASLTGVPCATRPDLDTIMRRVAATASADRGVARFRRAVMGFQVAVVVLLLTGSGLLLHSFWRLQNVDLGFDGDGVLTMEMRLLNPKYREPGQMARFQEDLMEAVRAVPGVEAASMTSAVPMRGVDFLYSVGGGAHKRSVDPGYFGLMRIPLRAGRLFSLEDSAASEPVAVVSESLGRNLFGEEDPIGRVMDTGNPIPLRIVGVVGDVRTTGLSEPPRPAFYVPRAQEPMELICLVIRSTPGAAGVPAAVQDVIHSIDPEQPVEGITTLDAIVARQTSHRRSYTTATLAFGLAALGMSMTGLMGMVSRMVSERRKDIAIRMAVGAGRARVLGMVVGNGMMPAAAGVLAGLAAAIPIARFLDLFLFEVTPLDPWTYAGVAATVLFGAGVACYVPARRATRLDPIATLRTD